MTIVLTRADVMHLLMLDAAAVEALIAHGVLPIYAYTRKGLPLFKAETVRAAALSRRIVP